jgi:hypothetical protein
MTRQTNARIAGFMFLFYIATGITAIFVMNPITSADGTAARLASIAAHAMRARIDIILLLVMLIDALVLATALFAITRDVDPDLAVLALCFRVAEGVLGGLGLVAEMGLLWIATSAGGAALDPASANALATLLAKVTTWTPNIGGFAFSLGSALFAYLFLRGRTIPVWLAWLGVVGSVLIAVGLPLQLAGFLRGPAALIMWAPIAVFEIVLGFWLLIRGVATPATLTTYVVQET